MPLEEVAYVFVFLTQLIFCLIHYEVVKFVVDEYFSTGNIISEGKVKRCKRKTASCRNKD